MKTRACAFRKRRKEQCRGSGNIRQHSVYKSTIVWCDIESAAEVKKAAQTEIASLQEQLNAVREENQMYRLEKNISALYNQRDGNE